MIDIATEILQSLQARNGKRIGMEEVSVIHPLPWDIRTDAAGYSTGQSHVRRWKNVR
jgi:hypothetical protein